MFIGFFARKLICRKLQNRWVLADLFSRRFQEGISFPNFVERPILKLALSKLCAVPFSPQNRALFEGEKCKKVSRKREEGVQQAKGEKGRDA